LSADLFNSARSNGGGFKKILVLFWKISKKLIKVTGTSVKNLEKFSRILKFSRGYYYSLFTNPK
jgi:hypothetical protein